MPDLNQRGFIALCALVFQTTSAVILTRFSKVDQNPETAYRSTTLVVTTEMSKLFISLALIFFFDVPAELDVSDLDDKGHLPVTEADGSQRLEESSGSTTSDKGKDLGMKQLRRRWLALKGIIYRENFVSPLGTLKIAVPAALYTLQNNLVYVALSNLEATTFQVGYQMKVLTTALLSVLMLRRSLSWRKWLSLCILTLGIILTQLDSSHGNVDKAVKNQNFTLGIVSVIICGFSSAFAGVYFEKILKGTNPSVWVRNSQLAFFSVLLGIGGMLVTEGFSVLFDLFRGYNVLVWSIIFVQAAGGIIIAVVIKYADNIIKGFATALSIVLCGMLSSFLFSFQPSHLFIVGSGFVIGSTATYSMPDPPPENLTSPLSPQSGSEKV